MGAIKRWEGQSVEPSNAYSLLGEFQPLATMRRFVILHHQSPTGEHWDVMLEMDDDLMTGALMTWSIPPQCPSGTSFVCPATALPMHRNHYLDYEGEITGNRGTVTRIDVGVYEQLSPETFALHGKNFAGILTLENNMMRFDG